MHSTTTLFIITSRAADTTCRLHRSAFLPLSGFSPLAYVLDYLIDELLLRQTEAVQTFLLHTCILERLCASLCAAVVGGEGAAAVDGGELRADLSG